MEGMPPMSLFEDETGVKLIIIIIIIIDLSLSSSRMAKKNQTRKINNKFEAEIFCLFIYWLVLFHQ